MLTQVILDNLPRHYSDTKKWGKQSERWDGIKFERDGLRIETHRRKKWVNHGTWKRFSASLRNPDEEFKVQLKNVHQSGDGKLALEIHVAAHLNIESRQAKWVKGVQLYSVNATGHALVRLKMGVEMGVQMGVSKFPPDLIFSPVATHAKISVDEFRIDRISKIGGELTQQVSDGVKDRLAKKLLEQETKIIKKINKQFDKKKDDFRISLSDAMKSKWGDSVTESLGDKK